MAYVYTITTKAVSVKRFPTTRSETDSKYGSVECLLIYVIIYEWLYRWGTPRIVSYCSLIRIPCVPSTVLGPRDFLLSWKNLFLKHIVCYGPDFEFKQ